MESGTNGGYAALTSSEVPSPVKATRPRKKHDEDVDHRYTSRKRGRREKDLDGGHHAPPKYVAEPREHHRSSIGEKAEPGSNANAPAAGIGPPVPPGTVLFLTHPGRDEIASGKSLLDLMRRSSRQKIKRRDDPRMEEAYFAVHDTVMVPQGLVDKIDAKLKDDFLAKVVADHTNNWIKMSSFVHNREFVQNLVQVVQPRYPCNYPTLLDEVLVAFLFQRPEYANTLLRPLIQRLTHSNEPVTADKHSLVVAMQRHIGQLKHSHGRGDVATMSTRHQIATLAIVKTLVEGNDSQLLHPWILACLQACSDALLQVIVAKVTNSIGYLAILQPDPHDLQWLRVWQQEHWDVPHADLQLEALVRLERQLLRDRSLGSFDRAVVREALNQFGNQPQNRFTLFGEAFEAFFERATTLDSFPLLQDTVHKYPPPYPNDASYTHPVVAMIGLFKQTIPGGGAWFVGHLWPFVLQRHYDAATLRVVFLEHVLPLVFGPTGHGGGERRPVLVGVDALVAFLDALRTVSVATAREVFQLWTQVWMDSSFEVPTPVVLTLLCVALGMQHGQRTTAAGAAVVDEFCALARALGHRCFETLVAQSPPDLTPISWLLQAVVLSKGGLSPALVVPLCQQVLGHLPEKPSVQWSLVVQRVLVMALEGDEATHSANAPSFYDSTTSTVVTFPLLNPSTMPAASLVIVSRLQIVTALLQDDRHPTSCHFLRRQLLSDTCFQALLDLVASTRRDVASHALKVLRELVPPASDDIAVSPFGQEFVVHALVRSVGSPHQEVLAGSLAILDRVASCHPDFLPLLLLEHCAGSPAMDVPTLVHLTNVTTRSLSQAETTCWWEVVQFIDRQFLLGMAGSWQDASAQHVALLMLRHLCRVDLRDDWSKVVCHGIRTLESSAEAVCLIQLDIVLWIVAHDQGHRYRAQLDLASVRQQVERLLTVPQWHVPSILAMAHQTLKGLDAYMAGEMVDL